MLDSVPAEKRLSFLDKQLHQKRQVKMRTCADVYDHWRAFKRIYKKAPKDGVEFQVDYIDTGLTLSEEVLASAPIALVLHGAPGSYHDFALLIQHLAKQNVRVIAPNFPEYTATVKTKVLFRHSADEKAAYLRDFLKAINVNKIDLLVSHSSAIFPTLLILLNANNRAISETAAATKAAAGQAATDLQLGEHKLKGNDNLVADLAKVSGHNVAKSVNKENGIGDESDTNNNNNTNSSGNKDDGADDGNGDDESFEDAKDDIDDNNNNHEQDDGKSTDLDDSQASTISQAPSEIGCDQALVAGDTERTRKHDSRANKKKKASRRSKRQDRQENLDVIVKFEQPIEIKAVALFNPAGHRLPKSMKPTWFKCGSVRIYQHKLGRSLFRKLGPSFLTIVGVPVRVDNMDNVMLSATVMRNSRCQRVVQQLEQLSIMKVPTLLVFSENDKLIEKEIFYEMAQFMKLDPENFDVFNNDGDIELSQSLTDDWIRVMVFKAGGHYAYSNYAKTVNKAVSELLEKVTRRESPKGPLAPRQCA